MGQIVHPGRLTALADFFPQTVTVQQDAGTTTDAAGQQVRNWQDVAGMTALPARISPPGRQEEIRRPDGTVVVDAFIVALRGVYELTPRQRLVDGDGRVHDILAVDVDGQGTYTRLKTEIVT